MNVVANRKYHLKFDTLFKNVIKATVGKKLHLYVIHICIYICICMYIYIILIMYFN